MPNPATPDPVDQIELIADAIKSGLRQIDTVNRVIDELPDGPAKDAAKHTRELLREVVNRKKDQLKGLLEGLVGEEWRLSEQLKRALRRLGFSVGDALGAEGASTAAGRATRGFLEDVGATLGRVVGGIFSAVLEILLNPTPISGSERRDLDSVVVQLEGKCYRITWFQTKYLDESAWSDIRSELIEVPCPDEPPSQR